MNAQRRADKSQRRPSSPRQTPNMFMGMLLQMARKYMFINPRLKAIYYFAIIAILSAMGSLVTFPEYYVTQKHNIFNQYGPKLGWMWTCLAVGPFIWYASKLSSKDKDRKVIDILRLGAATFMWWFTVYIFHKFAMVTSRCDKGLRYSRDTCVAMEGTWIPGMDISGHCFLMLYSVLIMTEESRAFRNWQVVTKADENSTPARQTEVFLTECFFCAMFVLNLFWDFQLIVSCLYYHIFIDKVLGAAVAVGCWALTYRVLYPLGFLQNPIDRKKTNTR